MYLYSRVDRLQAISRAVAAAIIRQAPHLSNKVVSIGYPIPDVFLCSAPYSQEKNNLFYWSDCTRKGPAAAN
jgi:hypothetical protein